MIVEFGYYDSFGKLAPICATKDSLFDSSVITTYISTLNEIDIVRLVLDDLKNFLNSKNIKQWSLFNKI